MVSEALEGHLGATVQVDSCRACQAFWFDRYESLQLSPRATLKLFRLIGEAAAKGRPPHWAQATCPHCGIRLLRTHDLQRNTPFEYWRCGRGHGRLISFYNFLREKDFIRPLSPAQMAELKRRLDSINCSNCGAPIDLATHSSCTHCGTPLSILDVGQAERLIAQLQQADRPPSAPHASPVAAPAPSAPQPADEIASLMRSMAEQDAGADSLIGAGLRSLLALLNTRIR